jgi:hypothetical protein
MTRDVFLLPSLRVLAAYANFLLALVIEAVFETLTLTTKIPVRLSRNRNSEYLPQRRKGRKVRRLRVKIIYKSFCPPRNLGAFAPWREEFPTPSTFDARLFAQAAQIFNYSNTKFGNEIFTS